MKIDCEWNEEFKYALKLTKIKCKQWKCFRLRRWNWHWEWECERGKLNAFKVISGVFIVCIEICDEKQVGPSQKLKQYIFFSIELKWLLAIYTLFLRYHHSMQSSTTIHHRNWGIIKWADDKKKAHNSAWKTSSHTCFMQTTWQKWASKLARPPAQSQQPTTIVWIS